MLILRFELALKTKINERNGCENRRLYGDMPTDSEEESGSKLYPIMLLSSKTES